MRGLHPSAAKGMGGATREWQAGILSYDERGGGTGRAGTLPSLSTQPYHRPPHRRGTPILVPRSRIGLTIAGKYVYTRASAQLRMIHTERQELLRLIEEMGEAYPEFRLGQLIANLAFWARGDQEGAVWNVEDEELMAAVREQIRTQDTVRSPSSDPGQTSSGTGGGGGGMGSTIGPGTADDPHDLARFVEAQRDIYDRALAEIRAGRKRSHWMWYVFPQFEGLGFSATSRRYAIRSVAEAEAYVRHPVLGPWLVECAEAVLHLEGKSAYEVFGSPDDMKLRSCATLFARVSPAGSVFARLLQAYFPAGPDGGTLRLLGIETEGRTRPEERDR